jgi:glucokinase
MCIGIDLGGTFTKFALLDEQMRLAGQCQLDTPAAQGPEGVVGVMAEGCRQLMQENNVSPAQVVGVGIGSPGPLDLDAGVVIAMPNIPGFDHFPLRDRLSGKLGLPATLENDANAAALGEHLCGSGRSARVMVLLTLGTGLGGGIVIDGKVLHGAHSMGAEIGHMIVAPEGELCGCGQRGCIERYASATYLALRARRAVESGRESSLAGVLAAKGQIDSRDVNQARQAGDALAAEIWDQACYYLGIVCVSLARLLDPDVILLGGGLAKAGEDLLEPTRRHFIRQHWQLTPPRTRLELASLGNDAGVIGAAGQAWSVLGKR